MSNVVTLGTADFV